MSLMFSNCSLIVAHAHDRVIGRGNTLPWNIPQDLQYFKETTLNNPIVMGYKTYQSIGKELPGRLNIVVSSKKRKLPNKVLLASSVQHAAYLAEKHEPQKEIFFIGGESIYSQVIPFVKTLYITKIDLKVKGDKFFPEVNLDEFNEVKRVKNNSNNNNFDFVIYKRLTYENNE